jgi:hypothetical protein
MEQGAMHVYLGHTDWDVAMSASTVLSARTTITSQSVSCHLDTCQYQPIFTPIPQVEIAVSIALKAVKLLGLSHRADSKNHLEGCCD